MCYLGVGTTWSGAARHANRGCRPVTVIPDVVLHLSWAPISHGMGGGPINIWLNWSVKHLRLSASSLVNFCFLFRSSDVLPDDELFEFSQKSSKEAFEKEKNPVKRPSDSIQFNSKGLSGFPQRSSAQYCLKWHICSGVPCHAVL